MKAIKLILFICLSFPVFSTAQTNTLFVLDALKKTPIADAHIMHKQKMVGFTNQSGLIELPTSITEIVIHVLGYKTQSFQISQPVDTVYINPTILQLTDDIVVYAHGDNPNINNYNNNSSHLTLDQILDNVDGISMIQRGAFAWEPMVRGQDDQRINVMIDGMQVFKACVDKMDPVTSYVESDNLSNLEIDKSGSGVAKNGNGNATINLITKKPDFEPFSFTMSTGVRYPDYYRVISAISEISKKQHSFRFSGSYKGAENFVAGSDSTINNSGFGKVNLNVAYRYKTTANHVLDVNYIYDHAQDVGYPALLMDATSALANMLRVQYNWNDSETNFTNTSLLVYANTVNHEMDDYNRDVTQRAVMRNMNMPMAGITKTVGTRLTHNIYLGNKPISLFLDGYYSNAFGDMVMESVFDIEDMYITNLGDINTASSRIGVKSNFQLSRSIVLKLEESLEFNRVELTDEGSISFFEGLYNKEVQPKARFLFSSSSNLTWLVNNDLSINTKAIFSQRQANYIESFGHYIYNYVDGFFYDGNPFLKPETTFNTELGAQYQFSQNALSLTTYYKRMFNYISGVIDQDISNQFYQFMQYQNIGEAYLTGFEFRWLSNWNNHFSSDFRSAFTYAKNITLNEPLPLIPPFHGSITTSYSASSFSLSSIFEWATNQNRIASQTSIEDRTNGFVLLNLEANKTWANKIDTRLSLNNLFDRFYNQHTSIGNIPESGRNIMLTINYKI